MRLVNHQREKKSTRELRIYMRARAFGAVAGGVASIDSGFRARFDMG
jgi:hypothetical protein